MKKVVTILFLLVALASYAPRLQAPLAGTANIVDTTVMPIDSEYMFTCPHCGPYPKLYIKKLQNISRTGFKNPLNYGAKGDGITIDDAAIISCFNAADAAGVGVLFPSGKTFLVSKQLVVNLTKKMIVWAYGATIKMKSKRKYSAFQALYPDGSNAKFLWLGGTFDGNQYNQIWPGNPHGGEYDGPFQEDHGRFVGVTNAKTAIFFETTVVNPVVDGIGLVSCDIAMIANSNASAGAPLMYNGTQAVSEQGTYFKTRSPVRGSYFINDNCTDGSIGIHVSFPENGDKSLLAHTVAVVANCNLSNQVQNPLHFEDCFKNIVYNCNITSDTLVGFYPSTHFSNNTSIVSIKKTRFVNNRVNFNQSTEMKLAILENCSFVSQFHDTTIQTFIEGGNINSYVLNCTFDGQTEEAQTQAGYFYNCSFYNYGANKAAIGVYEAANCHFENGTTTPLSLRSASGGNPAGVSYNNTYTNTPSNTNTTPVPANYLDVFKNRIDVLDGNNKFLGKITTGIE